MENYLQRCIRAYCFGCLVFFFVVMVANKICSAYTYMSVKAVVSQQSHELDDLVDVLVVVGFVRYKDPPCIQRSGNATVRNECVGSG